MFVVQRVDGKFVTVSGSRHSYSYNLREAQVFKTREAAECDRCKENERIVALSEVMLGWPR